MWKLEALILLVPKAVKLPTQEKKIPDGDQKKKPVFMGMPVCGGQLWGLSVLTFVESWYLQQTGFNVTDVGLKSQRAFLQKKTSVCLTRSLNFLKVPGWVKSPLILCSNLHLSPCQKVSPKESEIKCSSRQLMAFMTQIEICIWNHKIMQNQEPNLRSIGKIAWGNKKLNNRVENTFPFTWSGGSSGTF